LVTPSTLLRWHRELAPDGGRIRGLVTTRAAWARPAVVEPSSAEDDFIMLIGT
jgi:hypothetical protein